MVYHSTPILYPDTMERLSCLILGDSIICCGFIIICCGFIFICCGFIIIYCEFIFICCGIIIICCGFIIICSGFTIIRCGFIIICCGTNIICSGSSINVPKMKWRPITQGWLKRCWRTTLINRIRIRALFIWQIYILYVLSEHVSSTLHFKLLLSSYQFLIRAARRRSVIVVAMCFCEPIMSSKKNKGKMLNMLLLIREMFYYLKNSFI